MTTTQTVQSIIEFVILAIIIIGFIYEPIVAKWEQRQKEKILKAWKERKGSRK